MLFSLSWADALRKALQKALFCSGKALRARENKLLLLSWACAPKKALQKALFCSGKALRARENKLLLLSWVCAPKKTLKKHFSAQLRCFAPGKRYVYRIRIDLHTARATIKTQKALARVSPLDDES